MSYQRHGKILERDVEARLVRKVKELGGVAYKFTSPNQRSVPDRLVCIGGMAIFVELKRPGQVPTSAQMREHTRLRALGMTVHVLDTYDLVDAFIDELMIG